MVGLIVVGNNYSSEVQRCFLVGGALGSGMEVIALDKLFKIAYNYKWFMVEQAQEVPKVS